MGPAAISTISALSAAAGAVGTLMGAFSKPDVPKPAKPTPMIDELKTAEAKRRAMLQAQARGGRQSTMLSDASDTDNDTFGGA